MTPLSTVTLVGSYWSPHRWDGAFPPVLLPREGVPAHLAASGCWCGSREGEELVNLSRLCGGGKQLSLTGPT